MSELYIAPVKERIAYQVGKRIFPTKRAAAKAQAWNLILRKYGEIGYITKVLSFECDCLGEHEFMDWGIMLRHECCPLHNRYSGYFARLHKKLIFSILKKWDIS